MIRFSPEAQIKAMQNETQMFRADAFPLLSEFEAIHGREPVVDWLTIQIDDALSSSGVTTMKTRTKQIVELAHVILIRYGNLMLTELLVFFFKFKNGDFGDYAGVFNQQRFMKTLVEFLKYRITQQHQLKETDLERQRTTWAHEAVTREEYEAMKRLKEACRTASALGSSNTSLSG